MTPLPRDLLAAFRDALPAGPTIRRLTLAELFEGWSVALGSLGPAGAMYMGRANLAAAITAGAEAGWWTLPTARGRRWDRAALPPLPLTLDLPRAPRRVRDDAWRAEAWPEPLAWVPAERSLAPAQLDLLRRVRHDLASGAYAESVPIKTRSLQVTGSEKALETLIQPTGLLRPGRVPRETWNVLPAATPLPWTRVDPTVPTLLIVENAAPYRVLQRELAPGGPIGVLACGLGNLVAEAITGLAECGPLETIWYLGDLDHAGLGIACRTAAGALAAGLPAVQPLPGGYAAMFTAATRLLAPGGWTDPKHPGAACPPEFVAWVEPNMRAAVQWLLAAHCRIPEEVLTPSDWRALLAMLPVSSDAGA